MVHPYTNALIHETSLYLLQHAHNPVDWMPWSEKAVALAKESNKPIILSIGYAACHWCHVMEKESFEDVEVARLMNEHFICIKVDREERPDIDHIYMDAVQLMTGAGGWPLNVFLTPDGKPFYGGTYFPPINKYNRSSWTNVLLAIRNLWSEKKETAIVQSEKIIQHIQSIADTFNSQSNQLGDDVSENDLMEIKDNLMSTADLTNGGFGSAPKFPQTFSWKYLMMYDFFNKDEIGFQHAMKSIKKIIQGGIYDQLAGGMCRYSTDDFWLAPHFEKMLYDNALLIDAMSDAYKISKDPEIKKGIEQTIAFCERELKSPNGGYYAAIDADSEGEEGKFYTWSKEEIDAVLGEDAALFCLRYGVRLEGNWEHTNILHQSKEIDALAMEFNIQVTDLESRISKAKSKLLAIRNTRIRPQTDDKIILGWNALYLTALCKAYAALSNDEYKKAAIALSDYLQKTFIKSTGVYHVAQNDAAKQIAFLDDMAFMVQAMIHMQETTGNQHYLDCAKQLSETVFENFGQASGALFYFTQQQQKDVVLRKIEMYDAAIPSGNSVMAENLLKLGKLFSNDSWINHSAAMLKTILPLLKKHPHSFGVWAVAALKQQQGVAEVVITGEKFQEKLISLLSIYCPNVIFQSSAEEKKYPLLMDKQYENEALVYVCKDSTCFAAEKDINNIKKLLKRFSTF